MFVFPLALQLCLKVIICASDSAYVYPLQLCLSCILCAYKCALISAYKHLQWQLPLILIQTVMSDMYVFVWLCIQQSIVLYNLFVNNIHCLLLHATVSHCLFYIYIIYLGLVYHLCSAWMNTHNICLFEMYVLLMCTALHCWTPECKSVWPDWSLRPPILYNISTHYCVP